MTTTKKKKKRTELVTAYPMALRHLCQKTKAKASMWLLVQRPKHLWPAPRGLTAAPRRRRRRRGAAVRLLIRLDYDTWLRGVALAGETCELVGYGPVPLGLVKDLLAKGDPFVVAVLTRAKQVVAVAHLGRRPSAHQRSALEWLYPTCAAEGCTQVANLECDHRLEWSKTHYSAFDLLDRLCRFHHMLKSNEGWALVEGSGKRPFVPPTDIRHPRYRSPPPPEGIA